VVSRDATAGAWLVRLSEDALHLCLLAPPACVILVFFHVSLLCPAQSDSDTYHTVRCAAVEDSQRRLNHNNTAGRQQADPCLADIALIVVVAFAAADSALLPFLPCINVQ
jgi:hypothetical protein